MPVTTRSSTRAATTVAKKPKTIPRPVKPKPPKVVKPSKPAVVKESSAGCDICVDKFTSIQRKPVTCPNSKCDTSVCTRCVKTYLMTNTTDPKCMSCGYKFTTVWMIRELGTGFWKAFKGALADNAYVTETTWIPGDMEEIQYEKNKVRVKDIKKKMSELNHHIVINRKKISDAKKDVTKKLGRLRGEDRAEKRKELYNSIVSPIMDLGISMKKEYNQLHDKKRELPTKPCRSKKNTEEYVESSFKMRCSVCPNGFINRHGKCMVCDANTCTKCMTVKNKEHECDPNDVESVKKIKEDSKGCPKCGVMIHKIHGCSQMWCPECNTVFDWNTGTIQIGGWIHNPDYISASGKVARNAGDIRCGGYTWWDVSDIMSERCFGFANHLEDTRHFTLDHSPQTNKNARVKFVMGNATEKTFKAVVKRSIGTIAYHRDVRTILQCFVDNIKETGLAYTRGQVSKDTAKKQLDGNLDMINGLLAESGKLHGRMSYRIENSYVLKLGNTHV